MTYLIASWVCDVIIIINTGDVVVISVGGWWGNYIPDAVSHRHHTVLTVLVLIALTSLSLSLLHLHCHPCPHCVIIDTGVGSLW